MFWPGLVMIVVGVLGLLLRKQLWRFGDKYAYGGEDSSFKKAGRESSRPMHLGGSMLIIGLGIYFIITESNF